ncbi:hypothetical protein [Pseudothermotoga sp.]
MRSKLQVELIKITFLLFLLVFASTFAQTTWQKSFGGNNLDYARDVIVTTDGNFLIVGATSSYGAGKFDVLVLKVDQRGQVVWYKTFGGSDDDSANCVVKAKDGYLIAGWTRSTDTGKSDVYVVKIDENGNSLWQKTYGGLQDDIASCILVVEDGFIIAGSTMSIQEKARQAYLIKIDTTGKILWQKDYGGEANETFSWIERTSSGFIAVGMSGVSGTIDKSGKWVGNYDAYVVWLKENGEVLKEKTLGGPYEDGLRRVLRTTDGGHVAVGWRESQQFLSNYYIIKFSKNGEVEWEKVIETPTPHTARSVVETSDGYLIVGHGIPLNSLLDDAYLIKIGFKGEIQWIKNHGGGKLDTAYGVQALPDGFMIVGDTASMGTGGMDVYMLRTNKNGEIKN